MHDGQYALGTVWSEMTGFNDKCIEFVDCEFKYWRLIGLRLEKAVAISASFAMMRRKERLWNY